MIAPSERGGDLHLDHAITHRPICGADSLLTTADRLAFDRAARVCPRCRRRLERGALVQVLAPPSERCGPGCGEKACVRPACPCACHAGDPVDW